MREAKLTCRRKRHMVHTTDSKQSYQVYPNLVKGLQVEVPHRLTGRGPDLCVLAGRLCVLGLSAGCLLAQMHRLEPLSTHRCTVAASGSGNGVS